MKKLMILTIVLCFCGAAKAQITYHNYLDSTCEWRYYRYGGGWNTSFYITYYFDGDTLINGSYYYRQMVREREEFFANPNRTITGGVCGYLREDSNKNFIRAIFVNGVYTTDTIFKFDTLMRLNLNDSIPNTDIWKSSGSTAFKEKCTVKHKDTFYLGNRKLTAIAAAPVPFSSYHCDYSGVIEGIGYPFMQGDKEICMQYADGGCDNLSYFNKQAIQLKINILHTLYAFDSFPSAIRTHSYTPLPLNLIDFAAQQKLNKVHLNWHTPNESNHSYFNIQRSTNGKDYATIGKVNANCCSYNFMDELNAKNQLPNTLYYRLEIVDKDGSKTYSKTLSLNTNNLPITIAVYPNPSKGNITIYCAQAKEIVIIDYLGNIVHKRIDSGVASNFNCTLNKGIYLVKIVLNNGTIKTEKLLVE